MIDPVQQLVQSRRSTDEYADLDLASSCMPFFESQLRSLTENMATYAILLF